MFPRIAGTWRDSRLGILEDMARCDALARRVRELARRLIAEEREERRSA